MKPFQCYCGETNSEKFYQPQRSICKSCYTKERILFYRLKKWNLTAEDYKKLLEDQNGVCAICKSPPTPNSKLWKRKNLVVDHNHETGKIRGLLCFKCNTAIGKLNDDVSLLQTAIDYLKNKN